LSQVKDLNAKLARVGNTVGQNRHDLHTIVKHTKVEDKDSLKLKKEASDDMDEEGPSKHTARSGKNKGKVPGGDGSSEGKLKWEVKDTQLNQTAKDGQVDFGSSFMNRICRANQYTRVYSSIIRTRITAEAQHGMISQILKDRLFNADQAMTTNGESIIPEGVVQASR
jgi:hypothetical protein